MRTMQPQPILRILYMYIFDLIYTQQHGPEFLRHRRRNIVKGEKLASSLSGESMITIIIITFPLPGVRPVASR